MAILPRTLLTQPAPAAVAAVALLGFTLLGMTAHEQLQREQLHATYVSPCADLEAELGARPYWQEVEYVRYAYCLGEHQDDRGAVDVASEGLQRYPGSGALYHLKGYHEIGLREFSAAVETLEAGLRAVPNPKSGVMENNLAWSYLWTGEGGTERARALYKTSLARDPYVCEALHTGLFVEFEIARSSEGIAQAEAWRNFQSLRNRYQDCENRDAGWETAAETASAAVLFAESERLMATVWDQQGLGLTMRLTAINLRRNFPAASVAAMCRDAMPLTDLREVCIDEVQGAMRVTRSHRR